MMRISQPRLFLLALLGGLAMPLLSGCGGPAADKISETDAWDLATIQGQRIGHCHTTVRLLNEGGRSVVKAAQNTQLSILRYGHVANMDVDYRDTETPDGRLIDFELISKMGAAPMHTTGKVVHDHLELQVDSQGQTQKHTVAWPADAGGLLAPTLSLRASPLRPGQRRTLKHLNFDGQVCTTELAAQKEEPVELFTGSRQLLRIDSVARINSDAKDKPPEIKGTLWTDPTGETMKTSVQQMGIAFYRVSAEVASLAADTSFDLGKATVIKIEGPIRRPHDTKWVRYQVHLDGGDPATIFPARPSQAVKRIDEHTAEITTRAARSIIADKIDEKSPTGSDAPTDDDLKSNNFIQSHDPTIVAQAKEAVGDETDSWKKAVALEAYVHRAITVVDFSQAFATAAEVAGSHRGDCKGHAVYLAALARAQKIPARVVVGLVYMPQPNTFGGHMWTEVYVGGRWVGLDGTLGKGGIGGGHLQLGHSPMSGVDAYNVFYPVIQVVSGLHIKILDSE
jgi:transglutaminase-like putative cysteine protease